MRVPGALKAAGLAAFIILIATPLAGHAFSAQRLPSYIHGHNVCMKNVNRWLAANGFKSRVTHSAAASSVLRLRRVSVPKFGDIRFNFRPGGGGHVAVFLWGNTCLNAGKRGWRQKPCDAIWPRRPHQWRR